MKKIWLLIATALYLCSCSSSTDSAASGTIHGFVMDKTMDGDYVREAGVELRPGGRKTITGSDGRYEFTNLEPGAYSIIVTKKGYSDLESYDIIVGSNAAVKRDVQLERQPLSLRLVDSDATGNDIGGLLNFGNTVGSRSFSIFNDNPYSLEWEIVNNSEWVVVSPLSGTLSPNGGQAPVTVTIDRSKQGDETSTATISIISNSGTRDLTISTRVVSLSLNAYPAPGGTVSPTSQSNIAVGTQVSILATANLGYKFVNWMVTNGEAEISNEYNPAATVTLQSDATITANFQSSSTGPTGKTLAAQLLTLHTDAKSGGEYTIELTSSENIGAQPLSFSDRSNITVRITGGGGERVISLTDNGSLFTIGSGVTLILDDRVTLRGRSGNNSPLVRVNSRGTLIMNAGAKISGNAISSGNAGGVYVATDGIFSMKGGEISGNAANGYSNGGGGVYIAAGGYFLLEGGKITGNTASYGGGVYVDGQFIVKGGEITDNTASTGGGVHVKNGTFTMEGGKISSNTASTTSSSAGGGGVYVENGTFTMTNGEMSINTARSGGGVFVAANAKFTKTGGTIFGYILGDSNRNTATAGIVSADKGHAAFVNSSPNKRREATAGLSLNLNSSVTGAAGGWE